MNKGNNAGEAEEGGNDHMSGKHGSLQRNAGTVLSTPSVVNKVFETYKLNIIITAYLTGNDRIPGLWIKR